MFLSFKKMQKIPVDIQALLCATLKINSFETATKELVFNALDSEATSIAIRVFIENGIIQVVDNGCGITNKQLQFLGKRYMTSKYVDNAYLKPAINKYGYCGQSLANVVVVSRLVKITSRHESSEETYSKTFYKGKQHEITETSRRPSKGTTVEVKGFLYKNKISRRSIKNVNEVEKLKTFLEKLSLIHTNVSISLRDDSKNEILFKINKDRDIYQTFLLLFEIDEHDVQELQVQKNQYKVIAYIGKNDKITKQWIYLNGKYLEHGKLHKIFNEKFVNCLTSKRQSMKNAKLQFNYEEELAKNKVIPFYFIFISCPYDDYDFNQANIEFNNWDYIAKLLEKTVKFNFGDIKIKNPAQRTFKDQTKGDTRDQVKKIMDKIMKNTRKMGVSQLKNTVKGKLVKRKKKGKHNITLSKIRPTQIRKLISESTSHNKVSKQMKCGNLAAEVQESDSKKSKQSINVRNEGVISFDQTEQIFDFEHRQENSSSENSPISVKFNQIKNTKSEGNYMRKRKMQDHNYHHISAQSVRQDSENCHLSKFEQETGKAKKNCKKIARKFNKQLPVLKYTEQSLSENDILIDKSKENKDNCDKANLFKHKYKNQSIQCDTNILTLQTFKTYDLLNTIPRSLLGYEHKFNTPSDTPATPIKRHKKGKKTKLYDITTPLFSKVTFESHNYNFSNVCHDFEDNVRCNKKHYHHFIKKLSEENFKIKTNRNFNFVQKDIFKYKPERKSKWKSFLNIFNKTINNNCNNETKYTIEFTKTVESSVYIHSDYNNRNLNTVPVFQTPTDEHVLPTYTINKEANVTNNRNTSYITKSHEPHEISQVIENQYIRGNEELNNCTSTINETLGNTVNEVDIQFDKIENEISDTIKEMDIKYGKNEIICNTVSKVDIQDRNENCSNKIERENKKIVFVSHSQRNEANHIINESIEPINVCETVLSYEEIIDKDTNNHKLIDSLHNNDSENGFCLDTENISHHFVTGLSSNIDANKIKTDTKFIREDFIESENAHHMNTIEVTAEVHNFNLKTRPRFLPKGMSPIYGNCNTKGKCDYLLEEEYYDNNIYDNFVDDIQVNTEIFEPKMQNVNNATKDIEKVNEKLIKDNASLVFSGESLKNATVLGQVDVKFIAAIVKGKCNSTGYITDYLVLFDQHAVHERIRLEHNLADYLMDDTWKSSELDGFIIKLPKCDVPYLYNYKDKFTKLGLQWSFVNDNEVTITAIPKAILGKNWRQADIIVEAVKKLISEEINIIRMQKGCVSLHPKSIMDLVFSEACRYAIKFGDKLSTSECIQFLNMLADCKTPFQCAHGRPVMAVLTDVIPKQFHYKVNLAKIKEFKKAIQPN